MQFLDRHAVVQVLDGLAQDGFRIHMLFQADAGSGNQRAHLFHVQHAALAVFHHVQLRRARRRGARGLLLRTLFHALGPVQHIGARNVMLARTHQRQFDLVLHILDMEGAAGRLPPQKGGDDIVGQLFDQFAHPRRCRALPAIHREEGLGHCDGNLGRLETDDRTIAAKNAVLGRRRIAGSKVASDSGQGGIDCVFDA